MKKENITIGAEFEIVGDTNSVIIGGEFSVVLEDVKPAVKEVIGEQSFGEISTIKQQNGKPVTNATIIAYKNGIIYDYTLTDSEGKYTLYLEDGIYDIKIQSSLINRTLKNQTITNGIKPFRSIFKDGQILEKRLDLIEFSNLSDKEYFIQGALFNENGVPIENAEIIVADSVDKKILAFLKTDDRGKYGFVINNDINTNKKMDLVIRSSKIHAKVVRGFVFDPIRGFMNKIITDYALFEKGGNELWISY
ncbi:hypothetical protein D3C87_78020 [compost metagenome]